MKQGLKEAWVNAPDPEHHWDGNHSYHERLRFAFRSFGSNDTFKASEFAERTCRSLQHFSQVATASARDFERCYGTLEHFGIDALAQILKGLIERCAKLIFFDEHLEFLTHG